MLWRAIALASMVALSGACDEGRGRIPGGTGGPTPGPRDAASSRDSGSERADGGELVGDDRGRIAFDAEAPFDGGERPPSEDARTTIFDASPPPDAAPPVFPDAAPPVLPDAAPPVFPDAALPDASAPDAGPPRDGGTRGDAGTPACNDDSQCASGRCHPLYRQCVPAGQGLSCAPCTRDEQCGLPGDHCLDVSDNGTYLETICAQACNAGSDCPRGYGCSLNGHCYPIPGAIRLHTCASLADMMASEACSSFGGPDTCGISGYDDGTCVPTLGCTIGCSTTVDCPSGSTCTRFVVADYCVP